MLTLVELIERFLADEPRPVASVHYALNQCPNCGTPCDSTKSPYCGNQCREESAFVRQFRRALASGPLDEERKESMGQELWHVLGGGFPERLKQVPPRVRQQVLGRHEGRCEQCEQPASEIDHIRTACNRPINLMPVCVECRKTVELSEGALATFVGSWGRLRDRAFALEAVLQCDDPGLWDWREFLNRRKAG
ncbi:MAG TPA: HNH endonuclease signature motif containing protein [Fimbriimonadaceae bacterium]|nr:HNH endonuclease signature motif containing protein [Fimbriimonadaceae bacterium]